MPGVSGCRWLSAPHARPSLRLPNAFDRPVVVLLPARRGDRGRRGRTVRRRRGSGAVWGTWTLAVIVIAVIGIAVADELAIAHPGDEATTGFSVLAFGGPALFLIAQVLVQRLATGHY